MRAPAAALAALLACHATAAPIPRERAEAERIVGTWKMTLGAQGQTDTNLELDFYPGGKMVIRQVLLNGAAAAYEGTYRLSGTALPYDVSQGAARKMETLTVKKLTDTELIVVDPDGLKEEFTRVRKHPAKKDGK
jgi:uncharacterized protein (TIGR03066 family)